MAEIIRELLGIGLKPEELGLASAGVRAIVVYLVTIAMVRVAKKRFMGQASAFDVLLGIMLGSIVSRAVTGNAPLGTALAAAAALLAIHGLFSWVSLRHHAFGRLIKGSPRRLVRDGVVDDEAMRRSHMSEHDLAESLRGSGLRSPAGVAEAHLERNGHVSVIKAERPPRIIEVRVGRGVQTVRIELAGPG